MRSNTSSKPATPQERRQAHARFVARLRSLPPGTFSGVPRFIRAHLRAASKGGRSGYSEPGFHLGRCVTELEPHDTETDAWLDIIDAELVPLVEAEDDDAVLAWLVRRYPLVMAPVRKRRREGFVAGFYRGFARRGD